MHRKKKKMVHKQSEWKEMKIVTNLTQMDEKGYKSQNLFREMDKKG